MARLDDAELTFQAAGAAALEGWGRCVWGCLLRVWDDEAVVRNDSSGDTHLIPASAAQLLQEFQSGRLISATAAKSADSLHADLALLERIGLIQRDTPAA